MTVNEWKVELTVGQSEQPVVWFELTELGWFVFNEVTGMFKEGAD